MKGDRRRKEAEFIRVHTLCWFQKKRYCVSREIMKKNRCLRLVVPKARGLREGWGGSRGWQMSALIYRVDKQQGPTL